MQRPVKRPKAKDGVRPTSSKVRGAIYNMLPGDAIEGARVLDATCRTGALGLEAMDRGAAWVDFVDKDPEMCRRLRVSLHDAEAEDRTHVYCAEVRKALAFLQGPYAIVLMDPPYADSQIGVTIATVAESGLLKESGYLVVEHSSRISIPERAGTLALERTRRYGDTAISIFRLGVAE